MVALSGPGWVLPPSLAALFRETDARFPGRSTASDGTIGDPAHAARASDHNPSPDGFVYAGDVTHDPLHGADVALLGERLRRARDPRLAYYIHDRRTFRSYPRHGVPAFTWTEYTGADPHLHHAHVSILHTDAARRDTRSWWDPSTPIPESELDVDEPTLRRIVRSEVDASVAAANDAQNRWTRSELDKLYVRIRDNADTLRDSLAGLIRKLATALGKSV